MKETLIIGIVLVLVASGIWFGSDHGELNRTQEYVHYIWQN